MVLLMWEQGFLFHAKEKPFATPLYQLLLQNDATLLVVSDGGVLKIKVMARSVGFSEMQRHRTRLPNALRPL
jgi:hypothetical protein